VEVPREGTRRTHRFNTAVLRNNRGGGKVSEKAVTRGKPATEGAHERGNDPMGQKEPEGSN